MTKSARRVVTLTVVASCLIAGLLAIGLRATAFRWYLAGLRGHRGPTIIRRPVAPALVRRTANADRRTANAGIQNIAPFATVTVSSVEPSASDLAQGVADGIVDSKDWVTEVQTEGTWIKLAWDVPVTIMRVDLYPLSDPADGIRSGTLAFDDGSEIPVESLSAGGTPRRIEFPAKTVRSVIFRIDRAQGPSAGLEEIMAFGTLN